MKREIIGLFILGLMIGLVATVCAIDSAPSAYKGNIIIKDGKNPNGKILTAWVDGVATGSAIILENKYDIIVVDYTSPYNGKITFAIGNEKANESSTFVEFSINQLDLTFNTVPLEENECGDGVCGANECSNCAIDCTIFQCSNNSVCDSAIGENCLNNPIECGACPVTSPSTSSSGGGGGGGGSSSSSSTTTTTIPAGDLVTISTDVETPEETEEQTETQPNFFFGMTSAVVGFAKTGKGILTILTIVLVILLLAIITLAKRKSDKNVKE